MLQLNPVVGDVSGNTQAILDAYRQAVADGADMAVTGELALIGYPPRDLLERRDLLLQQDTALRGLAEETTIPLLVGVAERNESSVGNPLFNTVVFLHDGLIQEQTFQKQLLPTYDVFDEHRYFEPGAGGAPTIEVQKTRVGVLVCEDIWNGIESEGGRHRYDHDPIDQYKGKIDVLLVVNASPYYWGKADVRERLVKRVAAAVGATVVYVNQVGGNDELIFDGRSFAVLEGGDVIAAAPAFTPAVVLVDTEETTPIPYPNDSKNYGDLLHALELGLSDYVKKVGAFNGVLLGLSGGIDSALVAVIAARALGADAVKAVAMPSKFSSDASVIDARGLAKNIGIELLTIPIEGVYTAFGKMLEPHIGWEDPLEVTEENIQARARGVTLMAISNREQRLVLGTGNKSEFAMGYATLYGDMAAGLLVISDLPKTTVYGLAEYINKDGEVIPNNTITKPPSAELRPNQKDSDSLPDYAVLDPILHEYIEERLGPEDIIAKGHPGELVRRVVTAVDRMEFKRRQAAPGLRVTGKAFGSGRRLPIAHRVKISMMGDPTPHH